MPDVTRLKDGHLRILVRIEDGRYVAQCLDPDIAVQARTMRGLMTSLMLAIVGNVVLAWKHGQEPFANFKRAPETYWRAFEKADVVATRKLDVSPDVLAKVDSEWRSRVPAALGALDALVAVT